jgi:hypothetical protein
LICPIIMAQIFSTKCVQACTEIIWKNLPPYTIMKWLAVKQILLSNVDVGNLCVTIVEQCRCRKFACIDVRNVLINLHREE